MTNDLVQNKPSTIVEVGKDKIKNGAEAFVIQCEETNYISFNDYSKFGHLNLGRDTRWKQGDFYKALCELQPSEKDINDDNNPKLCKLNKKYIPCFIKEQQETHGVIFDEGDETKYYKKTRSGAWGFKYSKLKKFMKQYKDQINEIVGTYEDERERVAEEKRMTAELAKKFKCKVGEVASILLRNQMAELA